MAHAHGLVGGQTRLVRSCPRRAFTLAVAANLGFALLWWLALDRFADDGPDYDVGPWVRPVLFLVLLTSVVGLLGTLDRHWRTTGIAVLAAVGLVVLADIVGLYLHVLHATGGS